MEDESNSWYQEEEEKYLSAWESQKQKMLMESKQRGLRAPEKDDIELPEFSLEDLTGDISFQKHKPRSISIDRNKEPKEEKAYFDTSIFEDMVSGKGRMYNRRKLKIKR